MTSTSLHLLELSKLEVASEYWNHQKSRKETLLALKELKAIGFDELSKAVKKGDDAVAEEVTESTKALLKNYAAISKSHDAGLASTFDRDYAVALCSQAVKALSISGFNQVFSSKQAPDDVFSIEDFGSKVKGFTKRVLAIELEIYSSMLKAKASASVSDFLVSILTELETSIPQFYRDIGQVVPHYLSYQQAKEVHKTETLGRILLEANDSWREALCVYVASQKLRFEMLKFKHEGEANGLINKASKLAFDCSVPNGKNTSLASVLEQEKGSFIECWGVVKEVDEDFISDDSVFSRLLIETVSGKHSVPCVIRFARLSRMGICPGTYIRLNGEFSDELALLDGQPGISIAKLSHVTLAKKSWRYAFLRFARDIFPRWRHNLNISYSPMPHLHPDHWEGGVLSGANEMIFSPFLK